MVVKVQPSNAGLPYGDCSFRSAGLLLEERSTRELEDIIFCLPQRPRWQTHKYVGGENESLKDHWLVRIKYCPAPTLLFTYTWTFVLLNFSVFHTQPLGVESLIGRSQDQRPTECHRKGAETKPRQKKSLWHPGYYCIAISSLVIKKHSAWASLPLPIFRHKILVFGKLERKEENKEQLIEGHDKLNKLFFSGNRCKTIRREQSHCTIALLFFVLSLFSG